MSDLLDGLKKWAFKPEDGVNESVSEAASTVPPPLAATPTQKFVPGMIVTPMRVVSPVDQETLQTIRARVYGVPSKYSALLNVITSLGSAVPEGQRLPAALAAVRALQPDVTVVAILRDLDTHEQLLKGATDEFGKTLQAQVDREVKNRQGELSDIDRLNQEATQTIARLQQEIGNRTAQKTTLQGEISDAERKIEATRQRFLGAADVVAKELAQARQMLSAQQ